MTNRYGEPVRFIHFPGKKRHETAARRWINACRRPTDQLSFESLTYHHYICSLHWVGEDGPSEREPYPIPANLTGNAKLKQELAFQRRNKTVRPPQGNIKVDVSLDKDTNGGGEDLKSEIPQPEVPNDESKMNEEVAQILLDLSNAAVKNEPNIEAAHMLLELSRENMVDPQPEIVETEVNTCFRDDLKKTDQGTDAEDFEQVARNHWIDTILNHPMFYTGLKSKELLELVFGLVKDKAEKMTLWRGFETAPKCKSTQSRKLSTWEEFLLTIFRIRRGTEIEMTAHLFGISVGLASNIFITWTLFLEKELVYLRRFASVKCNEKHIPKSLRDEYGEPKEFVKGVRSIIDAVEFRCEAPTLPAAQKKLYSAYYNDNTYKLLIGCTPNGYINYTSDLWSGNVSDKVIVEKSGFLDHLVPGDKVMADKGFRIRGLLTLKQCKLVAPPALKGGKLKPRGSTMARKVSNARIHIERAIRRIKTFRILSRQLKLTQKNYMNSILKVCVSLANLGNDLVT